uniref:Uncharacterized protein n=1 Tax=Tetradesmus obliquus TaxID=3088 RepID=A0A383VIV9_TETOB
MRYLAAQSEATRVALWLQNQDITTGTSVPSAAAAAAAAVVGLANSGKRGCCACTVGNHNKASFQHGSLAPADTVECFDVAHFCTPNGASGTAI